MEDRRALAGRRWDISIEELSLERIAEIVRVVAPHEARPIRLVTADAEKLAVRVVDGSVECARDDERGQFGNRNRKRLRARDGSGSRQILRLEHSKQIDRMSALVAVR